MLSWCVFPMSLRTDGFQGLRLAIEVKSLTAERDRSCVCVYKADAQLALSIAVPYKNAVIRRLPCLPSVVDSMPRDSYYESGKSIQWWSRLRASTSTSARSWERPAL